MIVYKIVPSTGRLYIADPNYPNNKTRVIEYRNGALQPYSSALNAGDAGTVFDQIGYAAKTTLIDWQKISDRWAEFQSGTIGNDRFPAYTLWARNPPGAELIAPSPPVITGQPTGRTVVPGATVTFRVEAGPGTVSYQWRRDGANLPGATNATFTLAAAQPAAEPPTTARSAAEPPAKSTISTFRPSSLK
mgnify:CR=1 FL=1